MTKATDAVLGSKEQCQNCGHTVICGMSKATGGYAPKQQWQNPSGSAHYHTNGTIFKCHLDDGTIVGPKGVIEQQASVVGNNGGAGTAPKIENPPTNADEIRLQACISFQRLAWFLAVGNARTVLKLPDNVEVSANKDFIILAEVFYKAYARIWCSI